MYFTKVKSCAARYAFNSLCMGYPLSLLYQWAGCCSCWSSGGIFLMELYFTKCSARQLRFSCNCAIVVLLSMIANLIIVLNNTSANMTLPEAASLVYSEQCGSKQALVSSVREARRHHCIIWLFWVVWEISLVISFKQFLHSFLSLVMPIWP